MKSDVLLPLVLSSIAIVVSVASLTWQVVSWRRSGAVVKVLVSQALPFDERVWYTAVTARNKGRAPVTVTGWGLRFPGKGGSLAPLRRSRYDPPTMPYRLEPGTEAPWMMPTDEVKRICAENGVRYQQVRAFVRLGDGRTIFAPQRRGIGLK